MASLVILAATKMGAVHPDHAIGILTLFMGLIAYQKYSDEKTKEHKNVMLDLISFFRRELLPESVKLYEKVGNVSAAGVRMKLDVFDIESARKKYPSEFARQKKFLTEKEMIIEIVAIANVIEEFSVRVLTLSAEEENAILIVKDSYIKLCETISTFILHEKDASGGVNFKNTIELYKLWDNQ